MREWIAQLRKGLVELCVLAALRRGEAYGYQILQQLGEQGGALAIGESTVYPVLALLTADGLVRVRAAASPSGPPRRYYRLTAAGQARLAEMWKKTTFSSYPICRPPISTGWVVWRRKFITGVTNRSISSMAVGSSDRSSTSRFHWSG